MKNTDPKNKTILVVEDNEVVANEVARILAESGFIVLQAADGEKALEICRSESVDLVLLDIVLPNMTGLQCYDEIKKVNASIKIVLTSFAAPPASFQSKNPDFEFIEKTHDLRNLPKQIREILSHPGLMSLVCSALAVNSEY